MNKRISITAIHLLGCLIFLALPYLFAEDGFAKLADLPYDSHERRNVLSYLLTIAFFYTNYYLLIPRFFFRKQYVRYCLSALSCFLLIESALVVVNRQGLDPPPNHQSPPQASSPPPPMDTRPPFPHGDRPPMAPGRPFPEQMRRRPGPSELTQTFFLTLAGFLMAIVIRVHNRWQKTEREKIQTELSYLKAQINPHFLFNTLNSIYSLAIIESPPTADAIINLSSFLRYVIQESQKNQVSLRNELDYIGQYIALQKLRLGDTAQINFSVEGHTDGKQIVPLLLISFIENAFKYGVSPEEASAIDIAITIHEDELMCHVFNKKVRVFQPTAVASGIGLANTKARLQLLYPDRYRLIIADKPDSFNGRFSHHAVMIRAIALDDEPPALRVLSHFCQQVDFIDLQKTFTRTDEALRHVKQFPTDLLFLDINMPSMSGIDFYREISATPASSQPLMVIFTTAYAEYAVEGFTLNAVDYLLKPFTFERFLQAANKAADFYRWQQRGDKTTETYLYIRADYTLHKIALTDILFIEGLDDYLKIHLQPDSAGGNRPIVARMTMKAMLERLPSSDFIRVHRSYIVPTSRIEAVRNKTIFIAGHDIPIGASYEADFLNRFGK